MIAPVDAYPEEIFWNSKLIKRKKAFEQLDEIIFNAIESLRNNQKQLNENAPVTLGKLKEQLTILLSKEKFLKNFTEEIILILRCKRMTNSIAINTYHK